MVLQAAERAELSQKEQEVADLLLLGLDYREIASRLSVSTSTVNERVQDMVAKCGVSSKVELVMKLAQFRALPEDPEVRQAILILSLNEKRIASLLAKGLQGKEIGSLIGFSPVRMARCNKAIFEKLGTRNRTEAMAKLQPFQKFLAEIQFDPKAAEAVQGFPEDLRQIAWMLARGCTAKEIASQLFFSESSITKRIGTISQKLEVKSREELVAKLIPVFERSAPQS